MVKEIEPAELARWQNEKKAFTLLDVREPDEVATASLPDATHIPMGQIAQRLTELSKDVPIAVLCHHGGRSYQVAAFLAGQGFADVVSVNGGIDAYAAQVDRTIPRY